MKIARWIDVFMATVRNMQINRQTSLSVDVIRDGLDDIVIFLMLVIVHPDSLCTGISAADNRSICVCPLNKFGLRCLITDTICQKES